MRKGRSSNVRVPVRSVLYGETVEVAVAVALVEFVISRVVLGVVFSEGIVGDVRSAPTGDAAGVGDLSGTFNTNARTAPVTNGTTTTTHTSRSTNAVYLSP